jgi:acetoin utilization deacetylase AcuC-like enzyme
VIDWDVHVGDGTQDIFWGARPRARRGGRGNKEEDGGKRSSGGEHAGADDGEEEEEEEEEDEEVCVIDLHEAGAWPGGGGVELRGAQSASGRGALRTGDGTPLSRVINVPLPSGSGDATARAAFERIIVPVAARFKPEAIVVSAGFDAHELEPLAGLAWTDETYRYLGAATARLAERLGPCGVLLLLEGGYSRRALRTAVAALAEGAATLEVPPAPAAAEGERDPVMEREGEVAISAVVEEHGL